MASEKMRIRFIPRDDPPDIEEMRAQILALKEELGLSLFEYDLEKRIKMAEDVSHRETIFHLLGGHDPRFKRLPIVDKLLNGVEHEDIAVFELLHLIPYLAPVLHPDQAVEWLMAPEDSLPYLIAIRMLDKE